ncbi:MAG: hypothetical protein WCE52_05940 [Candidatus Acidiferrum sp.]
MPTLMIEIMDQPILVAVISFATMWFAAWVGAAFRRSKWHMQDQDREDFGLIVGAALTLLGLIIGFSFSMAINRYDQRKNYEEAEANAIGTEYVRADLLPGEDAAKVKGLLRSYLDQRIDFYRVHNSSELQQIGAATGQIQADLWNAVRVPADAKPTPVVALAVAGMNDVLNSQGYTQAAWWNRIPIAAWELMGAIAVCCNLLIGFYVRRVTAHNARFFVLPLIVAISFLLIADIDSPRGGLIHVRPQNLVALSSSVSR